MSYCVVISSLLDLYSGTISVQRLWRNHHACRVRRRVARQPFQPQRHLDQLLHALVRLSQRLKLRRLFQRILSSMFSVVGIIFAILSTSPNGMSSARPTSFSAAFAAIVPNVMICATFFSPYVRRT